MKEKRRQVGLRFQLWIVKWLEEHGYMVQNFTPNAQRRIIKGREVWVSKSNDPFGCVDIIAKKARHRTVWIQATLHKSLKEKIKKMEVVPWVETADSPQIWIRRPSKIVDIYQRIDGEFKLIGKIINRKFFSSEGEKEDKKGESNG